MSLTSGHADILILHRIILKNLLFQIMSLQNTLSLQTPHPLCIIGGSIGIRNVAFLLRDYSVQYMSRWNLIRLRSRVQENRRLPWMRNRRWIDQMAISIRVNSQFGGAVLLTMFNHFEQFLILVVHYRQSRVGGGSWAHSWCTNFTVNVWEFVIALLVDWRTYALELTNWVGIISFGLIGRFALNRLQMVIDNLLTLPLLIDADHSLVVLRIIKQFLQFFIICV